MGHDQHMQDVQYVPLYRIIAKSSLNTNFPTACPSASETVGLPGWSKIEHEKLIQDISYKNYLSSRQYIRIVK